MKQASVLLAVSFSLFFGCDLFNDDLIVEIILDRKPGVELGESGGYLVTEDVFVPYGSRLTIPPGTKIAFAADAGLVIEGELLAEGTPDLPIVLTGSEPIGGWWNGIRFIGPGHGSSRLTWCIVEYAGGTSHQDAAVVVEGGGCVMADCVIRHSEGYGVVVSAGTKVNEIRTANAFEPAGSNRLGDFKWEDN